VCVDMPPGAMKTGMLHSAPTVEAVADAIRRFAITNVVLDPVIASTSGTPLLDQDGVASLKRSLLPLALLVTPNIGEASALTAEPVSNLNEMEDAARRLYDLGARAVLVKGGHLSGAPIDVFFDGANITRLEGSRITTTETHGTGCVLAAAITAYLAHKREIS